MITVITGLPGAGKTSWAIEQILMPLAKKDFTESATDHHGNIVHVKRRIFTNINGLLIDHELIGLDEINTWPKWVKPGDLIIYDEIQEPWPKVPAGSKKPECIQQLEKHRHYGVDFVLLTQHPNLINDAVITLAGQHRHVRKVANSRFATVYEWDGVSRSLLYKNALVKKPWRRGREVETMYKSSALHTKQKRSMPSVLWVLLIVAIAAPAVGYSFAGKFKERYFGQPKSIASSHSGASASSPFSSLSQPVQNLPIIPPSVQAVAVPPKLSGCVSMRDRCECFDSGGSWITTETKACETSAGRGGVLVPYEVIAAIVTRSTNQAASYVPQSTAPVIAAFSDGHISR